MPMFLRGTVVSLLGLCRHTTAQCTICITQLIHKHCTAITLPPATQHTSPSFVHACHHAPCITLHLPCILCRPRSISICHTCSIAHHPRSVPRPQLPQSLQPLIAFPDHPLPDQYALHTSHSPCIAALTTHAAWPSRVHGAACALNQPAHLSSRHGAAQLWHPWELCVHAHSEAAQAAPLVLAHILQSLHHCCCCCCHVC